MRTATSVLAVANLRAQLPVSGGKLPFSAPADVAMPGLALSSHSPREARRSDFNVKNKKPCSFPLLAASSDFYLKYTHKPN